MPYFPPYADPRQSVSRTERRRRGEGERRESGRSAWRARGRKGVGFFRHAVLAGRRGRTDTSPADKKKEEKKAVPR